MTTSVIATVRVEEIDSVKVTQTETLVVASHSTWNGYNGSVVLRFDDNRAITVQGADLIDAVKRCYGFKP